MLKAWPPTGPSACWGAAVDGALHRMLFVGNSAVRCGLRVEGSRSPRRPRAAGQPAVRGSASMRRLLSASERLVDGFVRSTVRRRNYAGIIASQGSGFRSGGLDLTMLAAQAAVLGSGRVGCLVDTVAGSRAVGPRVSKVVSCRRRSFSATWRCLSGMGSRGMRFAAMPSNMVLPRPWRGASERRRSLPTGRPS